MSDWLEAEGHADRAQEMFERGRWAEAEAELRKALALNPDQAEWHFNLGLTLEAAGRDTEALAAYTRAAELMPEVPDPLIAAGAACSRLNRFEDALTWLDQALEIELKIEAAYATKIECLTQLGEHDEAETTFYLSQQALDEPSAHCLVAVAESLIIRRKFEHASWCLREAIRHDPTIPRVRARLASVAAATGQHQRAVHLYLRDLRDDPGNIDTLLDYGELLMDLGRLPEAAEKFRRVLELEPANVDAHYRLGHIAMRSRRYEQAHLEFELVIKLDASFPFIRLPLAEALLRRNMPTDARRYLCEAFEQFTDEDSLPMTEDEVTSFGVLLLEADMPEQAIHVLEKTIDVHGDSALRLRKLALAKFRTGDREGGTAISRRVLRIDHDCIVSIHNLALAALEKGQIRLAQGWIARGLRIDRHDEDLRRLRVRAWFAWGGAKMQSLLSDLIGRIKPR